MKINFPGQVSLRNVLDLALIPCIGFIIVARMNGAIIYDALLLVAAVYAIAAALAPGSRPAEVRITLIDISAVVILLSEIINYCASTYPANSFPFLAETIYLQLFYWVVRLNLRHDYQLAGIFIILAAAGLYVSVTAIALFSNNLTHIQSSGLGDLRNFRHLIAIGGPAGRPAGEWATILLALIPAPSLLALRFWKVAAVRWGMFCLLLISATAAVITFSRGIHLALLTLFALANVLLWASGLTPPRTQLLYNCLLVLTLVLSTWLLLPSFSAAALLPFGTTSQARSLGNRASVWRSSAGMFRDHTLFGVGSNNFALHYPSYKSADAEFVGRPFNIVLQIAAEKGVLGLCAYGMMAIAFLKVAWGNIRTNKSGAFRYGIVSLNVAAFASLLVRDLSYSSILTNTSLYLLLWFMFANTSLLCQEQ